MNWQAEQHRDWHTLNALEGGQGTCPWDCGWNEPTDEEVYGPQVRCGFCKDRHSVLEVLECSTRHYAAKA